ncbi:MAG: hypothetical protein WCR61_08555 [Bacteroidales bacterium]
MKKIIILSLICAFAVSLTAQPRTEAQRQQHKSQRYQKIQSAKIAFFSTELELTPDEAENFWPLYNEYWRARERANRRSFQALRSINRIVCDNEQKATDQELKSLMETYISNTTAEGEIHKEYYKKFLKIFPIEKVAKMYATEENFRIKMIHQLRSGARQPTDNKELK